MSQNRDLSHPHVVDRSAFFKRWATRQIPDKSPVPKSEGPGAPSLGFGRSAGPGPPAKAEILSWDGRDYKYRIILSKVAWVGALTEMAAEQTWSNFKNEASRFSRAKKMAHAYVDSLHQIWEVMYRLQGQGKRGQ
jgi:hypothetical protein